ncbi:PIN domain-containing protein [Tsukamurella tyrosinosolvens]|uniref:PIN domain-containing protein n=1 Tax=Tsukamurella tyrosinosolvens TaxID=57704 RepID=UPI000DF71015|nr:PIN domain-containing protein [Tsukamurella tyrosinosolvens]RDB48579.1 PIN domain-containing protein [Tsukamurella tyrosinosolvens]
MAPSNRILLDANVFYSRTLQDWFSMISLHRSGLITVMWTEDILAEARYHLRRDNPEVPDGALTTRFDRIRTIHGGSRIDGFDISHKGHPDRYDWHVVNAAIHGGVDYLVTDDAKFQSLINDDDLTFEPHTPDSVLVLIDDSAPSVIREVTIEQQEYWTRKPGCSSLPVALRNAGSPQFAERVRRHLQAVYC